MCLKGKKRLFLIGVVCGERYKIIYDDQMITQLFIGVDGIIMIMIIKDGFILWKGGCLCVC